MKINLPKNYWFIVLIFSIFPLIPKIYMRFHLYLREEIFLFVIFNSFLLLLPLLVLKKHQIKYVLAVGSIISFFSLIELFNVFVFKGLLAKHIFFIAFNTNPAETKEFIGDFLTWDTISVLFLYLGLIVVCFKKVKNLNLESLRTGQKIFMLFLAFLPLASKSIETGFDKETILKTYSKSNTPLLFAKSVVEYFDHLKIIDSAHTVIPELVKSSTRRFTIEQAETHVLIIGEAITKNKMSLYNYHRKTNPFLESIAGELDIFTNVQCTTPPVTDVNVTRMLTLQDQMNENKELLATNIINIMKQVGFKTYWLSNQGSIGHKITLITAIGMHSDVQNYTSAGNHFNLDERIFPSFERYLQDIDTKKKFIVIHINGAHNTYSHRYPKDFEKFTTYDDIKPNHRFLNKKKKNIINEYDNAILYNDWIVYKIIENLKNTNGVKSLVYIPDHGEEVYESEDRFGHGGLIPTSGLYDIPLITWISREYKEKLNLVFEQDRPFTSDHLIHTLIDLYGIDSKIYNSKNSLFSKDYNKMKLLEFK